MFLIRLAHRATYVLVIAVLLGAFVLMLAQQNGGAQTPVPTFTPPGGLLMDIIYARKQGQHWDVWAIYSDGSNPRNLTDGLPSALQPEISPDGTRLTMVMQQSGAAEIWVMGIDGRDLRQLTFYGNEGGTSLYPTWSPDGREIAYVSDVGGAWQVYSIGVEGKNERQITATPEWKAMPDWSPDGSQIVYVAEASESLELYIVQADGSNGDNPRRLTTNRHDDSGPDWSPDGTHIAYMSGRGGVWDIFSVPLLGNAVGEAVNLTAGVTDGLPKAMPAWSPDGKQIVYSAGPLGEHDVYVLEIETGQVRQLTTDDTDDWMPGWGGRDSLTEGRPLGSTKNLPLVKLNFASMPRHTTPPLHRRKQIDKGRAKFGIEMIFAPICHIMHATGDNRRITVHMNFNLAQLLLFPFWPTIRTGKTRQIFSTIGFDAAGIDIYKIGM